jgi:hypothetical protein
MNRSCAARLIGRCTLALVVSLAIARASAAQSLGLTPAEVRATFAPQQVLQFDLSVSNDSDTAAPMRASLADLWFDEKTNEKIFGVPGTLPRSAANWLTVVPATFVVPPHGTTKVKVMVTPPPDASGGAYAVVWVESKPQVSHDAAGGRPIYANMRLGALVLLDAAGTEDPRIETADTALTPPDDRRNLELTFRLRNAGNTHVFPDAHLAVIDGARRVVARTEAETRRFFPGQAGSMTMTWAGSLPPGDYTAILTIGYGKDKVQTQALPLHVPAGRAAPVQ